jgi:2-haloacid dehalogenase
MTVQAVVYDIGNVLIEWQPERFYDQRIGTAARLRLFAEVDLHAMNEAIDAGALFRETIYDWADRHPAWAVEIRWWYDHWIDMASPRIDHSIALMRRLQSKGVPVFALTNFGVHSFAYALTQYDFLGEFDRTYVSGRMGATKPDARIFEMVEQDCGLPPGALLFTDDRVENIQAAQARGWQAHLFDGPAGWAARLVSAGVLTAAEAAP